MTRRHYSSTAADTSLTAGINNSVTSITVTATTGFPVSFPYSLILDEGTTSEEMVDVTAAVGTTLTVTRGVDGTAPVSHSAGASVRHGVSARDFDEPNAHVNATSGVHGVTGALVGDTDTQTLTNKTLDGASNTFANIPQADTHASPDTDSSTTALHHTLGTGADQAAAGDHTHAAEDLTDDAWGSYTPTFSFMSLGNGTATFKYKKVGKTVHVTGKVVFGSTTSVSGSMVISLPVASPAQAGGWPLGDAYAQKNSNGFNYFGLVNLSGTTDFQILDRNRGNAIAYWGTSTPITWSSGDVIWVTFTYEAA